MNSFVNNKSFAEKMNKAEKLCSLLKSKGISEYAEQLEQVIQHAQEQHFTIAVVGEAKRGKSTLINGLLGRQDDLLAPIDKFPATNMITYYENGTPSATVYFQDGLSPKEIDYEDIRSYVCEDANPDNCKHVEHLEIKGAFPLLGTDVRLADTPGANNALSDLHDEVLFKFLPSSDVVIFLVTGGTPITDSEQQLLKQIRGDNAKKMIFVINKADKCTPQELEEGIKHNRKILESCGFADARLIHASARNFYRNGSDEGTSEVLDAVKNIIQNGASKQLEAAFCQRVSSIITQCKIYVDQQVNNFHKSKEDLQAEQEQIHELKDRMRENRDKQEREFSEDWDAAVDQYEEALEKIRKQLRDEFLDKLKKTSDMDVKPFGSTVHTQIMTRRTELLEAPTQKLSHDLHEASEKLQDRYFETTLKIPRNDLKQVISDKDNLLKSSSVLLAGVPATLGAIAISATPELLLTIVTTAAPSLGWQLSTWIPALVGVGSTALTGAVVAVLNPITSILTPILLTYGVIRVYKAWRAQKQATRDCIKEGIIKLISDSFEELQNSNRKLRRSKREICAGFYSAQESKLNQMHEDVKLLISKAPNPQQVADAENLQQELSGDVF